MPNLVLVLLLSLNHFSFNPRLTKGGGSPKTKTKV